MEKSLIWTIDGFCNQSRYQGACDKVVNWSQRWHFLFQRGLHVTIQCTLFLFRHLFIQAFFLLSVSFFVRIHSRRGEGGSCIGGVQFLGQLILKSFGR